jgi:hypothetical protein
LQTFTHVNTQRAANKVYVIKQFCYVMTFSLTKQYYSIRLELLTNATVVDDAMRFVAQKSKDNEKIRSAIEGDEEEPNELDYDEDRDQLEEEQEEEIGEATTNQVF